MQGSQGHHTIDVIQGYPGNLCRYMLKLRIQIDRRPTTAFLAQKNSHL